MSFLERYNNREYKQVWNELMQLGSVVRDQPVYHDAQAVARETMSRVRQNIELLIIRLIRLGFVFGYDYQLRNILLSPEQSARYLAYMENRAWVQKQPPLFLDAHLEDRRRTREDINPFLPDWEQQMEMFEREVRWRPLPLLERWEREIGLLPIAVRAWYSEIGAVNFFGYFAPWQELFASTFFASRKRSEGFPSSSLMQHCDPLQVRPLDEPLLVRLKAMLLSGKTSQVFFAFADDCYGKDYASGGQSHYRFRFPDASMDANDVMGMTFVEYLRWSLLQWAGFPGIAQWQVKPEKDLALLTEGLLPF